ncbi:MAG: type II toxin-antitoxin system Phd/YefM family antitoxin [Chloroflexi bacterium]|nr:type II toxin-antitoxin system Phd/YefM family antitoxin [Chloroflexota bacterium]
MKEIDVRELQQKIRQTLETAQQENVVITRHGEPVAILLGIEGYDWEDVFWATSRDFWKTIQQRRQEPIVPLTEARPLLQSQPEPDSP